MNLAYLALGSNLGDRRGHLREALRRLQAHPSVEIVTGSPVYETRPVGVADQPDFLNLVVAVKTALSPIELLETCLKIEGDLGRERRERWGPRTLDIDVLLHGDSAMADSRLTLPHPRMHERSFVMTPLAQIAPDLKLAGKTVAGWAAALGQAGVSRVEEWASIFPGVHA